MTGFPKARRMVASVADGVVVHDFQNRKEVLGLAHQLESAKKAEKRKIINKKFNSQNQAEKIFN